EIENDEQRQHADHRDRADPAQDYLVKKSPALPRGLDEHAFLGVRNADPALNAVELLQQLLLLNGARGRVHGVWLLRDRRGEGSKQQEKCERRSRADHFRKKPRHWVRSSRFFFRSLKPRSSLYRQFASPRRRSRNRVSSRAPCRSAR